MPSWPAKLSSAPSSSSSFSYPFRCITQGTSTLTTTARYPTSSQGLDWYEALARGAVNQHRFRGCYKCEESNIAQCCIELKSRGDKVALLIAALLVLVLLLLSPQLVISLFFPPSVRSTSTVHY